MKIRENKILFLIIYLRFRHIVPNKKEHGIQPYIRLKDCLPCNFAERIAEK
jgi:hypothetical protein